jgi:hypothetical protein
VLGLLRVAILAAALVLACSEDDPGREAAGGTGGSSGAGGNAGSSGSAGTGAANTGGTGGGGTSGSGGAGGSTGGSSGTGGTGGGFGGSQGVAGAPPLDASPDVPGCAALSTPYPAGPYGNKVDDLFPPLEWAGYVNETGDVISNTLPRADYSMDDVRKTCKGYALVHISEFY